MRPTVIFWVLMADVVVLAYMAHLFIQYINN